MAKTEIKINYAGVGALLKSSEVAAMVQKIASNVARNAGQGYGTRVHNSGQRQIANVFPDSAEAAKDNLENNTLLKAVHR